MALEAPTLAETAATFFVTQVLAVEQRGTHPVRITEQPADVTMVRHPV